MPRLVIFGVLALVVWFATSRPAPVLSATSFTVSVIAATEPAADNGLLGAQTAAVAHLRAMLPTAWSEATRGLGTLTVVSDKPGIVMRVVAASGTSVHRSSKNKASDIVIYVADDGRRLAEPELVSTAIHELGHIWCCRGAETSEGHWTTPVDDGASFGLNRYGLMNSPVGCNAQRDGSSLCPTRFSDRELASMGFLAPPPASADPCVAEAARLKRQIESANTALTRSTAAVNSQRALVEQLRRDVANYDVYRNGIPSRIYPAYLAAINEYNEAVDRGNQLVAQHNRQVAQQDVILKQYNSLAPKCVT